MCGMLTSNGGLGPILAGNRLDRPCCGIDGDQGTEGAPSGPQEGQERLVYSPRSGHIVTTCMFHISEPVVVVIAEMVWWMWIFTFYRATSNTVPHDGDCKFEDIYAIAKELRGRSMARKM